MNKKEYNQYQKQYQLNRYHRRRNEAIQKLGGNCKVCHTKENLEFDHIDQFTKTNTIAKMWSYSEVIFEAELAKCQLLCHEHHLVKTKLMDEKTGGGWNRIDNYDHGTGHMYNKQKCRCDLCRDWKRKYRAKLVNVMGIER